MSTATLPDHATTPCLPGCAASHGDDHALGFWLCETPAAAVVDEHHQVAISVTRVTEPGAPVFVSVSLSVGDREAHELAPDTARRVGLALCRAADAAGRL